MNNECIHYIKRAFKTAYPVVGRNHSFGVPTMYKVNSESEYLSEVKELSKLFLFQWKVIQENKYKGERLQYLWDVVMDEVSQ